MWFAGLTLGLLVGWLFLPTPLAMCGVWSSQTMPAWVQAIGSIVAILVAAGIPLWQQRVKRREEGQQLSISTLRLRSQLEVLGKAATDRAATVRGILKTPQAINDVIARLSLFEANNVLGHIEHVHHFEPRIQTPILDLVEELDQYFTEQGRLYDCLDEIRVKQFEVAGSGLVTRLERIGTLSFDAAMAIRIVDEEKRYPDLRAQNFGNRP